MKRLERQNQVITLFGIYMQPYTQKHIDLILSEVDEYFVEFDDKIRYFWALSNVPLQAQIQQASGGKIFGQDKSTIKIIDPFDGRKPSKLYHNYKTAKYDVGFRPTLILDTQLVTYLRNYVDSQLNESLFWVTDTLKKNVESFLRFAVQNNFDYNPFFYYMESLRKDKGGHFEQNAEKSAVAILYLHAMNDEEFLKSGKIVIEQERLKWYQEEYGGNNIMETARLRSIAMCESLQVSPYNIIERVAYASLLQMSIIKKKFSHKNKKEDIIEKLGYLRDFMEDKLNIFLMVEYYVSIFYFSDLTGNLIPHAQRNVNTSKAFEKFRTTTWDILLLRIPALQLMMDSDGFTNLGYIATADNSFAELASQFIIGGVIPLPPKKETHAEVFLYRKEKLNNTLGTHIINQIHRFDEERAKFRRSEKLYNQVIGKPEKTLTTKELEDLITKLEEEFIFLCK